MAARPRPSVGPRAAPSCAPRPTGGLGGAAGAAVAGLGAKRPRPGGVYGLAYADGAAGDGAPLDASAGEEEDPQFDGHDESAASPYGQAAGGAYAAYAAGAYSGAGQGEAAAGVYEVASCDESNSEDAFDDDAADVGYEEDVGVPRGSGPRTGAYTASSSSAGPKDWRRHPQPASAYAASTPRTSARAEGPKPAPKPETAWERGKRLQEQKARLPIQEQKATVLPLLCGGSPVCCLHGETGSGKSTQVPQMILEEARRRGETVRIAVTQPRRVAALNLAKRVAEELGEEAPGGTVGFRIGGESIPGEHIDFCTVGYLLQLFTNIPKEFGKYTHIVLDEVHERTAESDMLCLVVRLFVSSCYHQTRVVVMSATLQGDLFADYFAGLALSAGGVTRVHVGARCFPVEEIFLEDIASKFGSWLQTGKAVKQRHSEFLANDGQKKKRIDPRHVEKFQSIVVDLVKVLADRGIAGGGTTILVFLPGIAEISALWEEARGLEDTGAFKVFPLHSMIPREEQEMVFEEPAPGVTNVVLATDIAESSVTLPQVVAVIDIGLHRRVDHDEKRGLSALVTKWISQAAAKQRAGRAGRTRPGMCLRMYTRAHFDGMDPFEPPETASMPLDKLYLQAKQLCERLSSAIGSRAPHTAESVLQQLVQPPSVGAIAKARDGDASLGIITAADERASITALGRICLQLPIDLSASRLVWLGCLWGVAADAVVLASVLSSMDPFAAPSPLFMRDEGAFVARLRASASARLLFDGGQLSEPLMMRQLFLEWLMEFHASEGVWGSKEYISSARRRHTDAFSWRFSLSRGRMEHMISQVQDLALRTLRLCEEGSQAASQLRGLIVGLGYSINEQGDLSGIPWESRQRFKLAGVFEKDPAYLKSLLAAAFSDHVMVGAYGGVPRELDASPAGAGERRAALLKAMAEHGLPLRQTLVFPAALEKPEGYVDFVCGCPSSARRVSATVAGSKWSFLELKQVGGTRWEALRSRPSQALDAPERLPAEFNLLFSFDRNMRELTKTKAAGSSVWTHGAVDMQHPCRVHWEWMQQIFFQAPSGGKGGKKKKPQPPQLLRCEATCDKKNPLAFVAHVGKPAERRNVALLAVASQAHGSEAPGRMFPTGVTLLAPGHAAFLLATATFKDVELGLKSFAFTSSGCLAVLHRSISLPNKCVDKSRWHLIVRLREKLREALTAPEVPQKYWLRGRAGTLISDSPVAGLARELFRKVPLAGEHGGEAAMEDPSAPAAAALPGLLVDARAQGPSDGGPSAFRPLATWAELELRREQVVAGAQQSAAKRAKVSEGMPGVGTEVVLFHDSAIGPAGTHAYVAMVGPMQFFLPNGMSLFFAHQGIYWQFCSAHATTPAWRPVERDAEKWPMESTAPAWRPPMARDLGCHPMADPKTRFKNKTLASPARPKAAAAILVSKSYQTKLQKMSVQDLVLRAASMRREVKTEGQSSLWFSVLSAVDDHGLAGEAAHLRKMIDRQRDEQAKNPLERAGFSKTNATLTAVLTELHRRVAAARCAGDAMAAAADQAASSGQGLAQAAVPTAGCGAAPMFRTSASAVAQEKPLPPQEELLKLAVKELKGLLAQRGLSPDGCVEKTDLVAKLESVRTAWLSQGAGAAQATPA